MKDFIYLLRLGFQSLNFANDKCKEAADALERMEAELNSIKEKNAPEIVNIDAYITNLKEGLDGWHSRFLDMADQMQQAYAAGRESMREECLQECSAEATDNGTAQRIAKAIEGIK